MHQYLDFLDPPKPATFIGIFICGPHRAQPRHARDNNFHNAPLAGTSKTTPKLTLRKTRIRLAALGALRVGAKYYLRCASRAESGTLGFLGFGRTLPNQKARSVGMARLGLVGWGWPFPR